MYGNNNNSGGMGGNYNNGANQYGHGGSGSGHGHHGNSNYHQQRGMLMRNDRIRDNTLNRDQALQHWNTSEMPSSRSMPRKPRRCPTKSSTERPTTSSCTNTVKCFTTTSRRPRSKCSSRLPKNSLICPTTKTC